MIAAIVRGVAVGRPARAQQSTLTQPAGNADDEHGCHGDDDGEGVAASAVGVVSDEQGGDHRDELGAAVRHERALGLQAPVARSRRHAPGHAVAMRTNATIATMATPAAARGTNGDGGNGAPRRIACCTARHRR